MTSLETLKVDIKTFVISVLTAASLTFSGTLIWSRFLLVEQDLEELKSKIDYVDTRIDKRLAPIEQDIKDIKESINK